MNKENKKVVDSSKQEQLTMVDNIVIGNSELGNKVPDNSVSGRYMQKSLK